MGLIWVVALQCLFLMADMCPHFSGGRSPGSDSEAAAEQQGQRRGKCSVDLSLQYLHITGLTTCFSSCQGEASRYIFLNKFRKFLQENASNRGVSQRASLPASLTLRALWHLQAGSSPLLAELLPAVDQLRSRYGREWGGGRRSEARNRAAYPSPVQ